MKISITLMAICLNTAVFAQSNIEDVDLIQAIYGREKRMIVADFIHLDELQKERFWAIYDEYESKRKELGKKRVSLLEEYAANFDAMDDVTTAKIINETAALGMKTDKLITTYFHKIEKSVGVQPAAQFFQLEEYFLSAIRLKIFENIPFIGTKK